MFKSHSLHFHINKRTELAIIFDLKDWYLPVGISVGNDDFKIGFLCFFIVVDWFNYDPWKEE